MGLAAVVSSLCAFASAVTALTVYDTPPTPLPFPPPPSATLRNILPGVTIGPFPVPAVPTAPVSGAANFVTTYYRASARADDIGRFANYVFSATFDGVFFGPAAASPQTPTIAGCRVSAAYLPYSTHSGLDVNTQYVDVEHARVRDYPQSLWYGQVPGLYDVPCETTMGVPTTLTVDPLVLRTAQSDGAVRSILPNGLNTVPMLFAVTFYLNATIPPLAVPNTSVYPYTRTVPAVKHFNITLNQVAFQALADADVSAGTTVGGTVAANARTLVGVQLDSDLTKSILTSTVAWEANSADTSVVFGQPNPLQNEKLAYGALFGVGYTATTYFDPNTNALTVTTPPAAQAQAGTYYIEVKSAQGTRTGVTNSFRITVGSQQYALTPSQLAKIIGISSGVFAFLCCCFCCYKWVQWRRGYDYSFADKYDRCCSCCS